MDVTEQGSSPRRSPFVRRFVVAILLMAAGGGIVAIASRTRTNPTPNPTTTTPSTAASAPFKPVYLDTLTATGGDTVTAGVVSVLGRTYQHGIQFDVSWAQDTSSATYAIPRGATSFSVAIGNDDNQPNDLWTGIPLLYEVLMDNQRVAVGHALAHHHDPPLHVQVARRTSITLMVTNVGDAYGATKADWINPVFR